MFHYVFLGLICFFCHQFSSLRLLDIPTNSLHSSATNHKQGFFNGCIHDEGEHKARRGESLDRQFIYIGENYSGDVEQIKRRAKAEGMCESCNDNFHLLHGEQGPEEKENG